MLDLARETVGLVSVGLIVALIYGGLNVTVALGTASFLGVWALRGDMDRALGLLGIAATDTLNSQLFAVVPLFVLMGMLVSVADMGRDAFDVAARLFGRLRGGLGVTTVASNAVFAAITGISIASAAVFTRIAVPEMLRHGYDPRFAVGVVAGSSVLGMLIPPSLLLVLYGLIAKQSIGDLFIAGILPGLLLAAIFSGLILLMAYVRPSMVMREGAPEPRLKASGNGPGARDAAADEGGNALLKTLPILTLATLVLGGIYGGLFTPTEAGAVGALGALAIAALRGALTPKALWHVLEETGAITVSISLVILAASLYATMLALSGLPSAMAGWLAAADMPLLGVLALYCLVVIGLGCLLDSSSILLVVVPLMLPVLAPLGVDLIWFGIVTVVAVEIGLITPPFGISIFVIRGALPDGSISLADIFRGALPFVGAMVVALVILVLVPSISTVLVR